tara:strand:- start:1172 stop:1354 length:183 start_codon:yes stop_codon:yes gene_type:complete
MKIKAIGGKLSRIPAGLSDSLVQSLNKGKIVEVEGIHHRLELLVEEVKSKTELNKKKESE